MNTFFRILFLFIILGLANNVKGQANKLFTQNEIDSLNSFYTPLYPSDSLDISRLLNYQYINVFYFNGECSLCLNKMQEADLFYQEHKNDYLKTFFIVETSDTITFNFYRDKFNIDTQILWDQNYNLIDQAINTCFLIDKSGNIVIEGDFINDDKEQKEYINIIKQMITRN
ncbi:hypothetical protein [Draconibacterium sediminis]|uniref:Thioredoxin domain-containing protein n=1 Tax=Draconibacterium sediminis TaxID=1544798 RepID=A0A0D8JFI7_9BACT|nr:hypothetical protein [Draconibacterium sediminis]KJF45677.1 hypothetical protein LH29_10160 [Draconibacterium sediminis]